MKKLFTIIICFCFTLSALSQEAFNIWSGTPNKKAKAILTPFIATGDNATDISVIVCPGGSYFWLDKEGEGYGVAKWLNSQGISAFVLFYRVGGVPAYLFGYRALGGGNKFPYPIQDAQRALQYLRENADSLGINPNKIGIMGFSAGGHLSMYTAEKASYNYLNALGINTEVSLKPDFAVPIYPVVTMSDKKHTHKRSRRALLGEKKMHSKVMRDSVSLEKNITKDLPPIFLANCKDDKTVDYQNSVMLDSALTVNGINHEYHLFETGGHGFGAREDKGSEECHQWKQYFINWLKEQGFFNK